VHSRAAALVESKMATMQPQRWIGRVGKEDLALHCWPPRSHDVTPCDFFLWGFVKEAVYVPSLPKTLDNLKKPYHNCGELSDARHYISQLTA